MEWNFFQITCWGPHIKAIKEMLQDTCKYINCCLPMRLQSTFPNSLQVFQLIQPIVINANVPYLQKKTPAYPWEEKCYKYSFGNYIFLKTELQFLLGCIKAKAISSMQNPQVCGKQNILREEIVKIVICTMKNLLDPTVRDGGPIAEPKHL